MKDELTKLVERFIGRQTLVLQAMEYIRPDLLVLSQYRNWPVVNQEAFNQFFWLAKLSVRNPQSGIWNSNWDYYIHGKGCRLTHLSTHEPIEWDAPNIDQFDLYWFANWLVWMMRQENTFPVDVMDSLSGINSQEIIERVRPYLEELVTTGILVVNNRDSNKYIYIR